MHFITVNPSHLICLYVMEGLTSFKIQDLFQFYFLIVLIFQFYLNHNTQGFENAQNQ